MPVVDTITDDQGNDLEPLQDLEWELGGLKLSVSEPGDEGLDDVPELEGDDQDMAGDGSVAGFQRLASREVTLHLWIAGTDGDHDEFVSKLEELREVAAPLPDRTACRLLRWKRIGEPAKRLWVRPARGKALDVPGGRARLQFANTSDEPIVLRLEAPDPVIYSDVLHTLEWTDEEAHEIKSVVNAGSFTAVQPCAWSLTAPGPTQISHVGFSETLAFPTGPVAVSRSREITTPSSYGVVYGPGSSLFPRWPLLRPGENLMRADRACTFQWRDTW